MQQTVILVLVAMCGTGLGTAASSFFDNASAGVQIATPVFVLGLLFSGFYLSSRTMFAPLQLFECVGFAAGNLSATWVLTLTDRYTSVAHYGYSAMVYNVFSVYVASF